MDNLPLTEAWRFLLQQGVIAVVLVLVLYDYRRSVMRLITKLEDDKGTLMVLVKEHTEASIELKEVVERWVRVTEEANPRTVRTRSTDR